MEHHFDIEVAKEVGVNAAVIYYNIKFWCEKNRANDVNYHDGYYWTFNSVKAFATLFPYLSNKQISSCLNILEDKGYIKSGNYNDSAYDRTKWYADIKDSEVESCFPDSNVHFPSEENGISQQGEPIPNINTNINTNNKLIEKETKAKKESFEPVAYLYTIEDIKDDPQLIEAFKDFFDMRKALKKPLKTSKGVNGRVNECRRLAKNNHELMIKILNQSVEHEWLNLYELKELSNPTNIPKPNKLPFDDYIDDEGNIDYRDDYGGFWNDEK